MVSVPNPPTHGALEVVCGGFRLRAGDLERTATGGRLLPPRPTMFEQLIGHLGTAGPRRRRAVTVAVEARALVAVCLRWGTYLAVLMDQTRPHAAAVATPGVSRVADREMRRINIEASANLARWFALAHEDPERYFELVQAAQQLPMPRHPGKTTPGLTMMATTDYLDGMRPVFASAERFRAPIEAAPLRTIANCFVNVCWRNGPIEEYHAGQGAEIDVLRSRFTPSEESLLVRHALVRFTDAVTAFDELDQHWGKESFTEHALAYQFTPFIGPSGWATDAESAEIPLSAEELADATRDVARPRDGTRE